MWQCADWNETYRKIIAIYTNAEKFVDQQRNSASAVGRGHSIISNNCLVLSLWLIVSSYEAKEKFFSQQYQRHDISPDLK